MGTPVTRAVRRAAGLLRQRNFRLLWIGETISSGGDAMAVVGMPLLAVTDLHASTVAVTAASGGPEPGRRVMAPRPFRRGRPGQIIGLERGFRRAGTKRDA
jgi:hypothetical protein